MNHICDYNENIKLFNIILGIAIISFSCIICSSDNKTIIELKKENKTLKTIMYKSIDKVLLQVLKNGNDIEYESE